MQIFSADGRTDGRTDGGSTRGPRGPKNLIEVLSPKLHQKRDPSPVPLWSAPKKRFHLGLHLLSSGKHCTSY